MEQVEKQKNERKKAILPWKNLTEYFINIWWITDEL